MSLCVWTVYSISLCLLFSLSLSLSFFLSFLYSRQCVTIYPQCQLSNSSTLDFSLGRRCNPFITCDTEKPKPKSQKAIPLSARGRKWEWERERERESKSRKWTFFYWREKNVHVCQCHFKWCSGSNSVKLPKRKNFTWTRRWQQLYQWFLEQSTFKWINAN